MMRSLFSGVSGLKNHQVKMDVLGNNIANVNTTGFKQSRVSFQDMLSQTLSGGTAGGVNPAQVGLGMVVGAIDTLQTQGNLSSTGKETDMAIEGNGFFKLSDGIVFRYSRDGSFDISSSGNLVNPSTGYKVQGWGITDAGAIDVTSIGDISIPIGETDGGNSTSEVSITGNINAATADAGVVTSSIVIYDSLGEAHSLELAYTKVSDNNWTWAASMDGTVVTGGAPAETLVFDSAGALSTQTGSISITAANFGNGAATQTVALDFSGATQFSSASTTSVSEQDGYPSGTLDEFSIGSDGVITGVYSNGMTKTLGQIPIAYCSNSSGLTKEGDNMYAESVSSGAMEAGAAGTGGRGTISNGVLEMSNVDLAQAFTDMIITQRGFQANAKIISASDEMLSDLVNLKR